MNYSILVFSIIFSVLIILPSANAQIFDDSKQRSIEVKINSLGEVKVTHVISGQDKPHQIVLIDGKKENLIVEDEEGKEIQFGTIGDMDSLMIFPSREDVIVKYDLLDELVMEKNRWTMDFLYLQSTSFILPEDADLIFVNNRPVKMGDKKGIMCHGCQMLLEYSLNEPKFFEKVKILDKEYLFELRTFAKINQFSLNQELGRLSFEVVGENEFVTLIAPIDFLVQPYELFLDEKKIYFDDNIGNETHVWINIRPENSGVVTITGAVISDKGAIPIQDYSFVYIVVILVIGVVIGVIFAKRKKNSV